METTIRLTREAVGQVKNNFKLIFQVSLAVLVTVVVNVVAIGLGLALIEYSMVNRILWLVISSILAELALGLVLISYVQAWAYLATTWAVINQDKSMGVGQILKKSWGKVRGAWWIMFLSSLMIVGALVPLVIPGLILAVSISMTSFIYLEEGIGGIGALTKSRFYTQGYRWKLIGRFFLFMLVGVAFQIGLQGLVVNKNNVLVVGTGLSLSILSWIWAMVTCAFYYRNYVWLKTKKSDQVFDLTEGRKKYKALAVWGGAVILVSIIGGFVLAAVNPAKQMAKSRDGQKKSNVETLGLGVSMYVADRGEYPGDLEEVVAGGYALMKDGLEGYWYDYWPDINHFQVCTKLELERDYCFPK